MATVLQDVPETIGRLVPEITEAASAYARTRGNSIRPYERLKRLNETLLALRKITRDLSIEAMPSSLVLTNTQSCNLSCPYCGSHGTPENKQIYNDRTKDIPLDLVTQIADEALPFARDVWLSLVGEPLFVKIETLVQLCELFRRYDARLSVHGRGAKLSAVPSTGSMSIVTHNISS
jgi:hypothetical protein